MSYSWKRRRKRFDTRPACLLQEQQKVNVCEDRSTKELLLASSHLSCTKNKDGSKSYSTCSSANLRNSRFGESLLFSGWLLHVWQLDQRSLEFLNPDHRGLMALLPETPENVQNQEILSWSKLEENQNISEKILRKSESETKPVHKDLIWPSGSNKSHKDS